MCGILGVVGSAHPRFQQALDKLAHRGPDGQGIWQDSGVQLGHRRLAILDLSDAGAQPMHWGEYVLVFNGEIYNFVELREQLRALGHAFVTETDSEVVMHAFAQWGEGCLRRFNGMWALAIWHKTKEELFLARDRFGVKPLYYAQEPGRFLWASEQKALATLQSHVGLSPNFATCVHTPTTYESTDNCLLANVHRFPAGHYGWLKAGSLTLTRYWNTLAEITPTTQDYDAQCQTWRGLFLEACRIRNRSDVPVATALSGGLDSSSIFCAQHHLRLHTPADGRSPQQLQAFVASFPGTELDETVYAQAVLDHTGRPGVIEEMQFDNDFERVLQGYYYMEDLWPSSPVPMISLYQSMRAHGFRVSLDGHGGDELLSGYHSGYRALAHTFPHAGNTLEILAAYPEHDAQSVLQRLWWATQYLLKNKRTLSRARILHLLGELALPRWVMDRLPSRLQTPEYTLDVLQATNYQVFHVSLLPTLLRNYDRFSMAASIESRAPFMDYKLVQYTFGLPWQSLMRGGYTKAILRDALRGILTPMVATRRSKIGFNAPNTDLLRSKWIVPFQDLLASYAGALPGSTPAAEILSAYRLLLQQPRTRETDASLSLLWLKAMPYVWHTSFFKQVA